MSLIDLLTQQMLPGIGENALYEIVKSTWENITQKSWEDLYLDTFEQVVEEKKRVLVRDASDGEVQIDRAALLEVLHQDVRISPEWSPDNTLIGDAFLTCLTEVMHRYVVLTVSGNNLLPEAYNSIVGNLVEYARKRFLRPFRNNDNRFRRILQDSTEKIVSATDDTHQIVRQLLAVISTLNASTEQRSALHQNVQGLPITSHRRQQWSEMQRVKDRCVRVFLSSPRDVEEARKEALNVIECLKRDPFLRRSRIYVEAVAWDHGAGVGMTANETPQETVNHELGLPSQCHIAVVILWSRMGTPATKYHKPDGTPYRSGTEWEYLNALEGAQKSGILPQILVYRCKKEVYISLNAPDLEEKRKQAQLVEKFFAEFYNPDGSILSGYNEFEEPAEFGKKLGEHLRQRIAYIFPEENLSIENILPNEIVELEPGWEGSPFPGLRAFTREDAPIFFGRERETDELIDRIKQNRFIAVFGASGSGKSSLVWAGVVPRVEEHYEVVRFTPGEVSENPFTALAAAFKATLKVQQYSSPRELTRYLEDNPSELDNLCAQALPSSKTEVLLFIDQFEELFTLVKQPDLRVQFVKMLEKVREAQHFRILLTMRAEFYHRCLDWDELSRLLKDGAYPLSAPGPQSLYEMIIEPARIAGLLFERDLPLHILISANTNPGALPLMAYTLDELYKKAEERHDSRLTFTNYRAIGGVEGAIGKRAEETFKSLRRPAQEALSDVFSKLVTVNEQGVATRKRAPLDQVKSSAASTELVDALIEARLLITDEGIVEVAHEALFLSWEKLKDWIEQTFEDLFVARQIEEAIDIWKAEGKNEAFLWNGERLKNARLAVERLHLELSPEQEEFLQPEVERWEAKLRNDKLSHPDRENIGKQMNYIGDTRLGVGLRDADNLPNIAWCEVPGGVVQLEGERGEFSVERFYVAKYVITHKQFQAFVDDAHTGYQCDQWWANLARQEFQQTMQSFRYDNYPRTNVNWLEAMAFCNWLTAKLPRDAFPKEGGANWVVRLPTEWEWQRAASGGDVYRDYPWGNWCEEEIRCNDAQSGLEQPIAVGMYPQGISPMVGALDMVGNVSEWCFNNYENPREIDPTSDARRAVRGLSWLDEAQWTKLKFRVYENPVDAKKYIGFRIAYAPRL